MKSANLLPLNWHLKIIVFYVFRNESMMAESFGQADFYFVICFVISKMTIILSNYFTNKEDTLFYHG